MGVFFWKFEVSEGHYCIYRVSRAFLSKNMYILADLAVDFSVDGQVKPLEKPQLVAPNCIWKHREKIDMSKQPD